MAIWVDRETRVLVQGLGKAGELHASLMLEYGTRVVAGTKPGAKKGATFKDVPLFESVREAVWETRANVSVIFVPARFCADAILEAAEAGLPLVVTITEGIPTLDMVRVKRVLAGTATRLIGPNCPGIISPGMCKVGIMPGSIHKPGRVGVISRSGTLTYEAVGQLTDLGIGQSTCIGIGGDPVGGANFVDCLTAFNADPETEAVVMIGEIGGSAEEAAAAYVKAYMRKPVVGFIGGRTAPPGKRMGHAGAIISGGKGTAAEKMAALEGAGIRVAPTPAEIGSTLKAALR
ncbi:MAG TPA: succinate--CoA ligase subunit alpha [Myxococcota bacterium]|jgi:succinyl-CoA synthetase alpha subunit|nr:succinate--CoA ligase subunit alpha [Myxococcota bacterium]